MATFATRLIAEVQNLSNGDRDVLTARLFKELVDKFGGQLKEALSRDDYWRCLALRAEMEDQT